VLEPERATAWAARERTRVDGALPPR
jgi:hypothetical protein